MHSTIEEMCHCAPFDRMCSLASFYAVRLKVTNLSIAATQDGLMIDESLHADKEFACGQIHCYASKGQSEGSAKEGSVSETASYCRSAAHSCICVHEISLMVYSVVLHYC